MSVSLRGRALSVEEPVLMGIVNATPDSFSDVQRPKRLDELVELALRLGAEGAELDRRGRRVGPHRPAGRAGRGGDRRGSYRSSSAWPRRG